MGVATGAGGAQSSARGMLGTTALPCDVTETLKLSCQSCHGATPLSGVPMSLMSWEDFDAPAISNPALTVRDLTRMRIHDPIAPMPPTGQLPPEQLAKLDAWIDGGGVAGTDPTCAPVVVEPDPGGGAAQAVPEFADNCYEIRAHEDGDKNTPLTVNEENYGTFYFDAPWPVGSQGVYFEPLFGEHPEIVHHWLLYAEENGNRPDGTVEYPSSGSHPSSPTLIAGWAPGADNNHLPDDVGLQLDAANRKMSMEIHFFSQTPGSFQTNAGVRICTVERPERLRPHTATISWLGTELGINIPAGAVNSTATGTCNPVFPAGVDEIHILRSWPHMHMLGTKMRTTVIRQNGTREDMHPGDGWPFDFNNEVSHETRYILRRGDSIETTCVYTNNTDVAVGVGFENRYEMCFNFMTAYPAGALVNPGLFGSTSLTNSSTACLN